MGYVRMLIRSMECQFALSRLGRLLSISLFAVACPAVMPGAVSAAENCLQSPDHQAPTGSRWHYQTDRVTQRQCWRLKKSEADTSTARLPNRNHSASAQNGSASARVQTGTKSNGNAAKRGGDKPLPSAAVPADDEALFQKFSEWENSTDRLRISVCQAPTARPIPALAGVTA